MKRFCGLPAIALIMGFLLVQGVFSSCTKDPIEQSIPVVNAGRDTSIHLTKSTDSIQLNGSATDADGSIVAYSWNQISGPNTATIANSGSKQTWVFHLVTGTYVFQLLATDDDGNTGVKAVTITITAPPRGQTLPIVNAGRDSTYNLASASDRIKLNASATDDDGIVVGYSWTQVSGPSASIITNPGSKLTGVRNLASGIYVFQLMATEKDGKTGVKTVTITVSAPTPVYTLTLQPNNNPNEVLISYIQSTGDNSFPHHTQLDADAWTTGGSPHTVRGIFKMDLSALPANAKIISARLSLYSTPNPVNGNLINANYGTDNSMLIQRVTSDWNTTVKFTTLPSTDPVGQILIPHTNLSSLDLIDVDVTDQVRSMVQTNNYGWIIRLVNETYYNSRQFASSWHADATKHPKLVIQYGF
ncbi:MAG TPA: DNRLRE domain-containing protein [Flavisolibacter sp.]|nr:DNRLRE domain-containing protein [Flavisolibacter sp.]